MLLAALVAVAAVLGRPQGDPRDTVLQAANSTAPPGAHVLPLAGTALHKGATHLSALPVSNVSASDAKDGNTEASSSSKNGEVQHSDIWKAKHADELKHDDAEASSSSRKGEVQHSDTWVAKHAAEIKVDKKHEPVLAKLRRSEQDPPGEQQQSHAPEQQQSHGSEQQQSHAPEQQQSHGSEQQQSHGSEQQSHASGEHGDTYKVDHHAVLLICISLVLLTVLFETGKHTMEHKTPPMMRQVLTALFGELTVLGMIGLCAFALERMNFLREISYKAYGDEEHLEHLFETVHFVMFFVLVVYLVQTFLLLYAMRGAVIKWYILAGKLRQDRWAAACNELREAYKKRTWTPRNERYAVERLFAWLHERTVWLHHPMTSRKVETLRAEIRYTLLSERFIESANKKRPGWLPPTFPLAGYLRHQGATTAAQLLNFTVTFWLAVGLFLTLLIEGAVAIEVFTECEEDFQKLPIEVKLCHEDLEFEHYLEGWGLVVLSWTMLGSMLALTLWLRWVVDQLTPPHPLLKGDDANRTIAGHGQKSTKNLLKEDQVDLAEDSVLFRRPSQALIKGSMPYERRAERFHLPKKVVSLFPLWKHCGTGSVVFLVRTVLFLNAILLTIASKWLAQKDVPRALAALSILPLFIVIFAAPVSLLPLLVLATSLEDERCNPAVRRALVESKVDHMLRVMRTLAVVVKVFKSARSHHVGEGEHEHEADFDEVTRNLAKFQKDALSEGVEGLDQGSGTAPRLNKRQLYELECVFDVLSSEQLAPSGSTLATQGISHEDLRESLSRYGLPASESEEAEQRIFQAINTSGSGVISWAEFKAWVLKNGLEFVIVGLDPEGMAGLIFHMVGTITDEDGTEQLESDKLRDTLVDLGERSSDEAVRLTGSEVDQALLTFDPDRDSFISKDEVVNLLKTMKIQQASQDKGTVASLRKFVSIDEHDYDADHDANTASTASSSKAP